MKAVFIEVMQGFSENSYRELGTKEMTTIPIKGDIIWEEGSSWKVYLRVFMFNTEEGDYVKIYIEPYNL